MIEKTQRFHNGASPQGKFQSDFVDGESNDACKRDNSQDGEDYRERPRRNRSSNVKQQEPYKDRQRAGRLAKDEEDLVDDGSNASGSKQYQTQRLKRNSSSKQAEISTRRNYQEDINDEY